ncbi:MAG: radical SAM family heme chaperone HemW [Pseudomonadales bacterium]
MLNPGLYLHFPWCVRKCPYCDFNSHPLRGSLDEAGYVAALAADLDASLVDVKPGTIETVFCGGGTPSLFSAAAFAALLERLGPWLAGPAEITMEANPGTVEHHDFAAYRRAGVNRLSLGAQSFDAGQLRRLGRIHNAEDSARALQRARAGGFDNVNLDLMYGLSGQTADQALDDLEAALALAPEHLSWYQLTIEPKTEFARRPPLLPVEAELAEMERRGLERLARAGYHRYEVSAFARDGFECRHNLNYWRFGDYLGAGAGAHGKRSRCRDGRMLIERTRKASQPRLYLQSPAETEVIQVADDAVVFEFMLNALRLADGVSHDCFEARTGRGREDLLAQWRPLVDEGLVRSDRIAATELGWRHLDTLLQRFLS